MTINIDDFDQVKSKIDQLKKAVKDENFEGIQYYDLEILTNNEKKTISSPNFFLTIIDKHPTIIPHILEYVNSIETTIINPEEDTPPLGLIPIAALAITNTQYLKDFETFLKMLIEETYNFYELIVGDNFEVLLSAKNWDKNAMKFIACYVYEVESDHNLIFPDHIEPELINIFLEAFVGRLITAPSKDKLSIDKYDFDSLFTAILDDEYSDLQGLFDECRKRGKIPTYDDLMNVSQNSEDWDDSF